jgi:hypothetical protein
MEEPEVPTEHLHEHLHEHAHGAPAAKSRWIMGVALSSALLAGFAAVAALLAGHHSNEAMIEQIRAADQWNFFQAKGVKANVLASKMELLAALDKPASEKDSAKLAEYKKEQDEIKSKAEELESASHHHLQAHVIYARGVTLFQVAIAVGAVSALTRKRLFWFVSMGFGLLGLGFLLQGILFQ